MDKETSSAGVLFQEVQGTLRNGRRKLEKRLAKKDDRKNNERRVLQMELTIPPETNSNDFGGFWN